MVPRLQVVECHETDKCHTSTLSPHDDMVVMTIRLLQTHAEYVRLSCEQISETYDQCCNFMPKDECETLQQSLQRHHRILRDIEHDLVMLEGLQMDYYAGLIDESRYISQTSSIVSRHMPQ